MVCNEQVVYTLLFVGELTALRGAQRIPGRYGPGLRGSRMIVVVSRWASGDVAEEQLVYEAQGRR